MDYSHLRLHYDRFFQLSPLFTMPGWYFLVRDGSPHGPFLTRDEAKSAAKLLADECQESGDTGGR